MTRISPQAHETLRERVRRYYESLMADAKEVVERLRQSLSDDKAGRGRKSPPDSR